MTGVLPWINASMSRHGPRVISNPTTVEKQADDTDPVTSQRWFNRFRGANGAVQWLCSNTRPDLSADASIS
eukprot:5014906-Lingulodinium_polyedra.AAC.1